MSNALVVSFILAPIMGGVSGLVGSVYSVAKSSGIRNMGLQITIWTAELNAIRNRKEEVEEDILQAEETKEQYEKDQVLEGPYVKDWEEWNV